MRRRLAPPLVLLAAVLAAPTAPAFGAPRLPASVKLTSCSIDANSASFTARMRQVAGSERMWLRFQLLEKGAGEFHVVKAPGLGRWRKSRPLVGVFSYRQNVRGLQPGAVYRTQVGFRWYDGDGRLLGTARRRSPACRQFVALPNLSAKLTRAEPARKPGVMRYHLWVDNRGIAPAMGVPVRLTVDGHVVDTFTIASLAPGEGRSFAIHGPACERAATATADPDGVLVESSELDNASTVACAELVQPGAR